MPETLLTTTTFSIEGYRITEYKGLVRGIIVRSPTIGQGFFGGLKQIVGGQIGRTRRCASKRVSRLTNCSSSTLANSGRMRLWESDTRVRRSAAKGRPPRFCVMALPSLFNVREAATVCWRLTDPTRETSMFLVREIMFCKPGKVRPMVEKFLAMNRIGAKSGMPKMRVMTDFCAERYWMLVAEMEVETMDEFEQMMKGGGQRGETMKEMEDIMKDYHDLVESGRREVYKIEG